MSSNIFGELKNEETFVSCNNLSDECYEHLNNNFPCLKIHEFSSDVKLLYRFINLGETTSESVRLLLSNNKVLPALALIRIRLEQVIVFSYLIYEDPKKGIVNFLKFLPTKNEQLIRTAVSNEVLKPELIERFKRTCKPTKNENNGSESDARKNWTKLDLLSMAKRRDELIKNDTTFRVNRLETDYAAFYKMFSSLVHCDVLAINDTFASIQTFPTNEGTFSSVTPNYFYYKLALTINAHFDLIQVYDFCKFLKIGSTHFFQNQDKKLRKQINIISK